jgi:hypothetical protein
MDRMRSRKIRIYGNLRGKHDALALELPSRDRTVTPRRVKWSLRVRGGEWAMWDHIATPLELDTLFQLSP